MDRKPVCSDAAFVAITGAPATGKTQTLVDRVAFLIAQGVAPCDILVCAASSIAAAQLRERMDTAAGGIEVTTPWEMCVRILSTKRAIASTGRTPRVLADFEMLMLMKDMEMLGGDRKRDKEIVKYLLREWTELGEDKPRFLMTLEESNLNDGMKERLALRGGVLKHELANIAVRYLRDDIEACSAASVPYVLVDDYQNLCLASQILVEMLAETQIIVAGNSSQCCEVLDPYPYREGFDKFFERHEGQGLERYELKGTYLSVSVATAVSCFLDSSESLSGQATALAGLGTESDIPADLVTHVESGLFALRPSDSPASEVAELVSEITDLDQAACKDTLVVVPDARCGRLLEAELSCAGMPSCFLMTGQPAWGRVSDDVSNGLFRAYTLLNLAANPSDGVAWRAWFGYGDSLLNCGAWRELEGFAAQNSLALVDALQRIFLEDEKSLLAQVPHMALHANAYAQACEAIVEMRSVGMSEIPRKLAQLSGVDEVAIEVAFMSESAASTVQEVFEKAQRKLMLPEFPECVGIRIATPSAASGLTASRAYVVRAVDGLYPGFAAINPDDTVNHRRAFMATDERAFFVALTRGTQDLFVSYPKREALEHATKSHMRVARISACGNERMATLAPSRFIAALAGDSAK